MKPSNNLKIVAIGGSLRPESQTYTALRIAKGMIEEMGGEVEMIDIRGMNLPFCDGSKDYPEHPGVEELRGKVKSAGGILLATPEYHGSISGVLKNALDLLDFEHVEGKVVAVIAVLGGEVSTNAINDLRTICRHLHMWVIPDQLVISFSGEAFSEKGDLIDTKIGQRMHKLIKSLLEYAHKLS